MIISANTTSNTSTHSTSHSSKLSTGVKVGVGIGGAAVFLLVVIVFLYLCRRKRWHRAELADTQIEPPSSSVEKPSNTLYEKAELSGTEVKVIPKLDPRGEVVHKKRIEFVEPQELDGLTPATLVRHELDGGYYVPKARVAQEQRDEMGSI